MLNSKLDLYKIEMLVDNYIVRGNVKPLGDLIIFLNDKNRGSVPFYDTEFLPLALDRQVKGIQQPQMTMIKDHIIFISVLEESSAEKVQLLKAKRPVVFYVDRFAIHGNLHVNSDSSDEDLLDDSRDFYAISEAKLFPIRPVAQSIKQEVPLLIINRLDVTAYHTK